MMTFTYQNPQPKKAEWRLALCVLFGFFAVTALEHCSCEPKGTGIENKALESLADAGEKAQASCVNVPDTTFLLAKPRIPEQSHKEKPSSPNLRCTKIKVFGREVSGRERYAAFSGDGKTFVLRGYASGISVWDTKTVKLLKNHDMKNLIFDYYGNISYHPTDDHILLIRRVDEAPELTLFDLNTGKFLQSYKAHCDLSGAPNKLVEAMFVENGKYILAQASYGATLYDTKTGAVLRHFHSSSYLMSYDPNEQRLALFGVKGTNLWLLSKKRQTPENIRAAASSPEYQRTKVFQFTPDGQYLLRGGTGNVFLWSMEEFKTFRVVSQMNIDQIVFHPNGNFAFLKKNDADKEIYLYSFPEFSLIQKLPSEAETFHMTISPDGKYFLKTGKLSELWKCE